MSPFSFWSCVIASSILSNIVKGQINDFIKEIGVNGEDIWRSRTDFIPVQSAQYGAIKIGEEMSMEFDFTWHGRTYDPSNATDVYEQFFRIGCDAKQGTGLCRGGFGCYGEGASYPSFSITPIAAGNFIHISVSNGSQCHTPYRLSDYGSVSIGESYHVQIRYNQSKLIIIVGGGGRQEYVETHTRKPTQTEFLGFNMPVWWMSNGYVTDSNRGNGTFSNITIVSKSFPTESPTIEPTLHPSSGPTVHQTSIAPTLNPAVSTSKLPTEQPTKMPIDVPSTSQSMDPSIAPTLNPTVSTPTLSTPTLSTEIPTKIPTDNPSTSQSMDPSIYPSIAPTLNPSASTSKSSEIPTKAPIDNPATSRSMYPSIYPSTAPTLNPSVSTSKSPTEIPTKTPIDNPSTSRSMYPSIYSSTDSSTYPSIDQPVYPAVFPATNPTAAPSETHAVDILTTKMNQLESEQGVFKSWMTVVIVCVIVFCLLVVGGYMVWEMRKDKHRNANVKKRKKQNAKYRRIIPGGAMDNKFEKYLSEAQKQELEGDLETTGEPDTMVQIQEIYGYNPHDFTSTAQKEEFKRERYHKLNPQNSDDEVIDEMKNQKYGLDPSQTDTVRE